MQPREHGEPLDQRAECESSGPPTQRRPAEPREHTGQVRHEGGGVQPDLRQPELLDVEPHPPQRGHHDDGQQNKEQPGEVAEHALVLPRLLAKRPISAEQDGQDQGARRDELEEPVACVLGIGQVCGTLNQLRAAKEVAELDDDEDEEQHIEQAQRGADGDDAERQVRGGREGEGRRRTDDAAPEVSGGERRPGHDEGGVGRNRREVDVERVRHQVAEHGVG